jgi:putative glutamine amidotransferase
MKPIIALTAEIDENGATKINRQYIKAIECAGGIPFVLPYTEDSRTIAAYVETADGFLFTGGVDIAPERYGEEKLDVCGEIQYKRDAFELSLLPRVLEGGKPVLAICRGAQLVNVGLGGTLYQDIPTEMPSDIPHRQTEGYFSPSHSIRITDNTPLRTLMGNDAILGNSFHHQAIKTLGKGLEVMATSDDVIIEAVRLRGYKYLRAYKWHPERLFETDAHNKRIFEDFIVACKGLIF